MTKAAVAPEVHQPLDVHGYLRTQFPFDLKVAVYEFADTVDICCREVVRLDIGIDLQLAQYPLRSTPADSINIGKTDLYAFVFRQIYASNSCQCPSSSILVAACAACLYK